MSKINQIQEALKEIDGGKFQKLCDAYLKARGFGAVNALGSVIGKDKTKVGTPDTFARDKQGRLNFVEYTTQQSGVYEKFLDDLSKCIDPTKTGVALSDIHKIIFCHNSNLPLSEENDLVKAAEKEGLQAEVYGLDAIAYGLYVDFPWLARDFLGIQIDTEQILPPDKFVEAYDKNQLTTPLATEFHFRSDEVQKALEHLRTSDLLLLSGPAGVGKSRIALEVIAQYQQLAEASEAFCILSKGLNLFDDLKVYFSNRPHAIIFIDDANRTTNFEYLIDLLKHKKPDQTIKIVATVRDYALEKVEGIAKQLGSISTLAVTPLTDAQIHELIEKLYPINNSIWLERIGEVAGGNPRLAIMAAQVALKENSLASINDVSALYDHYFAGIRADIEALGDDNIIKVAGIIAFFRAVDRSSPALMSTISSTFNIDQAVFWSVCQTLHKFELVDIYEEQVVKISDQVMATYLFYLHFLKTSVAPFEHLVDAFFSKHSGRIRDALYPCLNSFDAPTIVEKLEPLVLHKATSLEKIGDRQGALEFLKLFWFAAESKILSLLKDEIDAMPSETSEIDKLEWEKPNTNVAKSHVIETLKIFQNAKNQDFELAVHLICSLVEKQPSYAPDAIYALSEEFGFNRKSHTHQYARETRLVEILIERTNGGSNEVLSLLFLAIAKHLLHTSFRETTGNRHTITIHTFKLLATDVIFSLREKIWEHCFAFLKKPPLERMVLDVFKHYASSGLEVDVKEIQESDAKIVVPLMLSEFSPDKFAHGLIVQMFLQAISHLSVEHADDLAKHFDTEAMRLFRVLSFDYRDMEDRNWQDFEATKKQKIGEFTKAFNLPHYRWLFKQYVEFADEKSNDLHSLKSGLSCVFSTLADRDGTLFEQVVLEALSGPQELLDQIHPYAVVWNLFQTSSVERVREIVGHAIGPNSSAWRFAFHLAIPENMITEKDLNDVTGLFENSDRGHFPYNWGALEKYVAFDVHFIVKITKIINGRAKEESKFGFHYGELLNSVSDLGKRLGEIFVDHIDVLQEAYILHHSVERHSDYNGAIMGQILDCDPKFLCRYFLSLIEGKAYLARHDDRRDYSFVWRRNDAATIVESLIDLIAETSEGGDLYTDYIATIFVADEHKTVAPEVVEIQDAFLMQYIAENAQSGPKMRVVFEAISEFPAPRRLTFIELFLKNNTDFQLFKGLELEPWGYSCTGSAVPTLTRKMEFWQTVAGMCNSVALLPHRQLCEGEASDLKRRIAEEKKHDFIDD